MRQSRHVETLLPAGDDEEHTGCRDSACDLGNHVGDQVGSREALAYDQSEADGWVEVAAGDVSDGINHGDDGEAECQGNSGESDTQRWECGGK